jgi:bifunctional UDP-N-acetylglucosamine pyrophosphorylase/glucosamine-1-phosphate N-acetyltransferase
VSVDDPSEVQGVNDRAQLANAEATMRHRINRHWMLNGVTMPDPAQVVVDVDVRLGRDVTIHPGSVLRGQTTVASGCVIGPRSQLLDCEVDEGAVIEACVARSAFIGANAHVGPYAVLETGERLEPGAITGPFYTRRGADGPEGRTWNG